MTETDSIGYADLMSLELEEVISFWRQLKQDNEVVTLKQASWLWVNDGRSQDFELRARRILTSLDRKSPAQA